MMNEKESRNSIWNLEKEIDRFWKENNIIKKYMERNSTGPEWFFTEGPPTANGLPHIGHVLTRAIKDAVIRYQVLSGRKVIPFIAGWDCHGLPVEVEVEKELKLKDKKEIDGMGIDKFNNYCKLNVYKYKKIWEEMSNDLAYWLDYENAYTTMSPQYVESVWWALKELHNKGLLEEGYRVGPYCPRCQTTLSSHEVAQGYKEVEEQSIYVKMRLQDEDSYLLIWTTTPWTLPSNMFIAIREDEEYSLMEFENEHIYVATKRKEAVFGINGKEIRKIRGRDLIGKKYVPLYPASTSEKIYYFVHGDFVSMADGSGAVHIAPAFGIDDFDTGKKEGATPINLISTSGKFTEESHYFAGKYFLTANKLIFEDLRDRSVLFKTEQIKHTYPFCWRCNTPLIYYLQKSWFVKTSTRRELLLKINNGINWIPDNIKEGRFGNFLIEAKDWAVSRSRYWGTPLPVWRCKNNHEICIGSFDELISYSGMDIDKAMIDPHRPYVDDLKVTCRQCGDAMVREPYVIDCWFDSGSAPFAQFHYPFDNRELFERITPVNFASEAIDQTRGWFYSMHTISSLIFEKPAYSNVIVLGHILDKEGKKLSKSKGNAIEPSAAFHALGADSIRLYFYSTKYTLSSRFSEELVRDSSVKVIMLLLNSLNFFKSNAELDHFQFKNENLENIMDLWLISLVNKTVKDVKENMEKFELKKAIESIVRLIESCSNWYIRRSRDRFWGGGKNNAYSALFMMLYSSSLMLAPFTPHIAEHLYQQMKRFAGTVDMKESVMVDDYPSIKEHNEEILFRMDMVMGICEAGRKIRQDNKVKLRQPVKEVVVLSTIPWLHEFRDIITDELNCKVLRITDKLDDRAGYASGKAGNDMVEVLMDVNITDELYLEGISREIIRRIQITRKELDLPYDKKISLYIDGSEDVRRSLTLYQKNIMNETLVESVQIERKEEGKDWKIDEENVLTIFIRAQ
jgi:isoleucyl-tRNA synthetase